ncbi:putative head stabilization/decoration protein [Escherichia phage nomo]|uniref:Head stabilization/decoration protein n=2 Tax=Vequintavirus TaxID=1914852 RepID=A0A653HBJ9_9CAUD|nr:hypothetical protein [Escherichia coli]EIG2122224.1 hypothetical protein [Escherichia coli]EKK2847933.1 hypothetical protein [Escherichia coli O157]QHR66879.1 putative head stabilization/decoration protein [Escherichia phage nomo]VVG93845.1 head stabilization/decoration protein [Escherichia phage rV5_ev146]
MITAQYSDIVLGKVDSSDAGYNFKEMEVQLTEHHHAGTVVTKTGTIANDDGSDVYGVLVDRALITDSAGKVHLAEPLKVGQKYKLVVAVHGVTFAKDKLLGSNGEAAKQAVLEKLEALGNKVHVQTLGEEE